jgi:D-threo-aldose 1-dehydrogenase
VRRSLQESLERLGLERLALVYLHDPEHISFEDGVAPGGPVQALVELQREGLIDHLGVAGGPIDLMRRYIRTGAFEVVITHNRFTLVDRSAEPLLDEARELDVAVVNAAPFGGGVLAKGPAAVRDYAYGPAHPDGAWALPRAMSVDFVGVSPTNSTLVLQTSANAPGPPHAPRPPLTPFPR